MENNPTQTNTEVLIQKGKKTIKTQVIFLILFAILFVICKAPLLLMPIIPSEEGRVLAYILWLISVPVTSVLSIIAGIFLSNHTIKGFKINKKLKDEGIKNNKLRFTTYLSTFVLIVIITVWSILSVQGYKTEKEYKASEKQVKVNVISPTDLNELKNHCEKFGSSFHEELASSESVQDNYFYCENVEHDYPLNPYVFNTNGFKRLCSDKGGIFAESSGETEYTVDGNLYTFDDLLNCNTSEYTYWVIKRDIENK